MSKAFWRGATFQSESNDRVSTNDLNNAILVKDVGSEDYKITTEDKLGKINSNLKSIFKQLDIISGAELDIEEMEKE